jgi:uncharacterized protein YkwD
LRKLAAAILAAPVIAVIYVPVILRRSIAARISLAIGVGGLVGLGALGAIAPAATLATPRQDPIVPLVSSAFTSTIAANTSLRAPITLAFSAPMDATSVAGSLEVQPNVPVNLTWDATATQLTITPKTSWAPATYHTISVLPGALGASGRPMVVPARAAFLTRAATLATIVATSRSGDAAKVDTAFRLTFDGTVAIDDARRGLQISPAVDGTLESVAADDGTSAYLFTPAVLLQAGTTYTVGLDGVVDSVGEPVAQPETLTVTTVDGPRVIRFRPVDGTQAVARTAALSVRFSQAMEHATTRAALHVTVDGKAIAGTIAFAEHNTVVVFTPTSALPYGGKVAITVAAGARSADHATISTAAGATFSVEARTAAAPTPTVSKPKSTGGSGGSSSGSSGGSVGGGSWGAVETYYLGLMNCTRTGGWVTSSGSCSSPGGRAVAALRLDSAISSKVSRPYAKLLATRNLCSHFIGGNPGNRLSRAGYTSYIWAENLGCRSGNPKGAVLGSHLFFQSERPYNGGHYVNLMNAKYDRVGIGVWVSGGSVRLVIDFYHPR